MRPITDESAVFPAVVIGSIPASHSLAAAAADDAEFRSAWEKSSIPSRTDYELFQKMNEKYKVSARQRI